MGGLALIPSTRLIKLTSFYFAFPFLWLIGHQRACSQQELSATKWLAIVRPSAWQEPSAWKLSEEEAADKKLRMIATALIKNPRLGRRNRRDVLSSGFYQYEGDL
jgi:hypothetical protein